MTAEKWLFALLIKKQKRVVKRLRLIVLVGTCFRNGDGENLIGDANVHDDISLLWLPDDRPDHEGNYRHSTMIMEIAAEAQVDIKFVVETKIVRQPSV
jgi:hypothetical protein